MKSAWILLLLAASHVFADAIQIHCDANGNAIVYEYQLELMSVTIDGKSIDLRDSVLVPSYQNSNLRQVRVLPSVLLTSISLNSDARQIQAFTFAWPNNYSIFRWMNP